MLKRIGYLFVCFALLLSACQPVMNHSSAPAAAPTAAASNEAAEGAAGALPDLGALQVAFVPVLNNAALFVANDKGYFREQGLTVELQSVRNVDEMLAPLSTGKLDATGVAASTGFFNAMAQGLDFRLVSGSSDPAVAAAAAPFLVVSKALFDSGAVTKVTDLKGHKLAINLRGSSLEYILAKGLEQAGLTLADVELVTIPGAEMLPAVENGAVDGAVAGILNIQRMVAQEVAVPLLSTTDVFPTGGDAGGVAFGQRLLQPENREVGIRFIMAYLQAARFLNDGGWTDPEVVASIQKYTGMEPAMIEKSPVAAYSPVGEIDEVGVMDVQTFQIANGYVEYTEPVPFEKMIDLSMLAEAVQRLDQE